MDPELIRTALGWSTLINMAILLWWFAFFTLARDWMQHFHGRWFRLSDETFDAIHYGGMAFFKSLVLVFNLVPWLVLTLAF